MADNVEVTPGSGTLISTEEVTTLNGATVSAQEVQRVIVAHRTADGTAVDGGQGNVAAGATDSGNPVKVGGKYNATAPTYTDGQRGDVQLDNKGNVKVNDQSTKDPQNDAISTYAKGYTAVNLTASGQILGAPGVIDGFIVNSGTSVTVRLSDALTATTPYLGGAMTPSLAQYVKFPALVSTAGFATLAGTTPDVTFFVRVGVTA